MNSSHETLTPDSIASAGPPVTGSCLRCGTALPLSAQFCPACGTARQVAARPGTSTSGLQPPDAARPRRNLGLIIALVVLVVSIVGSGLALVLSQPEADPAVAALRSNAGDALDEFVSLDEELNSSGVKYLEYSVLVDRVDEKLSDLDARTPSRLDRHPGMVAMNDALVEYRDALSAWSDNIDCTYCDPDDVDSTLDSHWSMASDRIDDARSALDAE
jgi:hypothetical protein